MKVLYLHTTAPPKLPGTDALHNAVNFLADNFDGETANMFPFKSPNSWYPRALYGMHNKKEISSLAAKCDLIHLFSPTPVWYQSLDNLSDKPILLSVVAGAKLSHLDKRLQNYRAILTSSERAKNTISKIKNNSVELVIPGIDVSHISLPPSTEIQKLHLLMASAPWTKKQFDSKGVELLLDLMRVDHELRITFLWRETLYQEMLDKVTKLPKSVSARITLINEKVDINKLLQRVDVVTLLARDNDLVKAYPHSLVEGLAAGRPLLLTRSIAMSDYVDQKKCGLVLESFTLQHLQNKVAELRKQHSVLESSAREILANDFDQDVYLEKIQNIYSDYM